LTYSETIRFHGHNGPFLALGYKLGRFFVRRFRPKGIMDFKITVQTRLEKPFTCLIDGLQCSTFATLGKGNIMVKDSKSRNIMVFVQSGDKKFKIKITKTAMNICLNANDLNKASNKIFRTPIDMLYKIM